MSRLAMMAVTVWVVGGCGGGNDTVATSVPAEDTRPPATTATTSRTTTTTVSEAIVDAAIADLADHLQVGEDQVSMVSFEEVTWRDGSLGCPEPGMAYTQALVDGSRTVLEVDGVTYAYHAGGGGEPFLCENPEVEGGRLTTTVPGYDY